MGRSTSSTLPLLPLPRGLVLLPGVTLSVPIADRPDINSLLALVLARANSSKPEAISIGCVPLNSQLLSSEGQNLIKGAHEQNSRWTDISASEARKDDLFKYGTAARISAVQGDLSQDAVLVLEGIQRFKIKRIKQRRPFFEAEVTYIDEKDIDSNDSDTQALFEQLKRSALQIFSLVRILTLISGPPRAFGMRTTPLISARLDHFIASKEIEEAGVLADFMTNAVGASLEEKLRVLASLDVKERLEKVNELLSGLLEGMKKNVKITTLTGIELPNEESDTTNLERSSRSARIRRGMNGIGINGIGNWLGPPGFAGPSGRGRNEGLDEIAELKKKLQEAKLPPEGQKVADRELKRLSKMSPQQAEYGVCRTYLETLSEVPWSTTIADKLGPETLKKARKQLDDDHYGLEKVKKRLLEYLAVLRLKQAINGDIEAAIAREAEERKSLKKHEQDEYDENNDEEGNNSSSPAPEIDMSKIRVLQGKRRVDKSPIILLVGPPGTGKTSLANSIALALGRKFHRISLGGVRDEAEIRGHRRTYVAAMPGLIVGGLRKVGVSNPVFLLDEIDKVGGSSFHGDPSAAMLEVLDPEQNYTFTDHYINIPIDLSKVLFIATANSLETIPPPLLDRMETITLSGYTTVEKRHIAKQHLIPKQITANGLDHENVRFTDDVIDTIITSYTRESGVRNLEREIGSVCRYKAVEYSDAKDASNLDNYQPIISLSSLELILGISRFDEEIAEKESVPGIVTGLVAFSTGIQGSILFVEVAGMPGKGRVQLTGKLGDVLKESVEVALTWVKAHAFDLGLTTNLMEDIMRNRSVHVHCPSGAIPKDGPSAGLAHTIALISLFSNKAVPPHVAMTGEISLRGKILPVGGIKEKLIGALRAGVKTVLLPEANRRDVDVDVNLGDLPIEVKQGLEIVLVGHVWEAIRWVWPEGRWRGVGEQGVGGGVGAGVGVGGVQSRL